MNTVKYLKATAAISALLSIILHSYVFWQPSMNILDFQTILIPLHFAEAFTFLTLVLLVLCFIYKKATIDFDKMKIVFISTVAVVLVACTVLCIYQYSDSDCYSLYTPEKKFKNEIEYMQQFYPYHDIEKISEEQAPRGFEISHMPGTDYIHLYSSGAKYSEKSNHGYEVEYIKSISPLMNFRFLFENIWPSAINEIDESILPEVKIMKVDGVSFVAYINQNNYGVLFSSYGESVYAVLTDASDDVTVEVFAREVIKQSDLLTDSVKDGAFAE